MAKCQRSQAVKAKSDISKPTETRMSEAGRGPAWLIAIIVAQIVPYIPSLRGDFALDDWGIIVRDPLAHSLSNAPRAFLTDFLHGFFGPDVFYYRPLVTITFQANWAMAGQNPFVFRLTNLLMAIATCILVYVFARRVTRSAFAAGVAGMAFAVLPSHSEAVAWVSGRTDVMSCLFTVAGLLAFTAAWERSSRFTVASAIATGLLFICALFSKENALTLPLLAAGYVWVSGERINRKDALKWALAFIIPFAIYFIIRRYAVHVTVVKHMSFLLGKRMLGVGIAYATYLRMLFVPLGSCVAYDVFPIGMKYPVLAIAGWGVPVGLGVLAVWARRRLPVIAFGAFWILITLLPVSNILPTSGPLPTDRFVFLASVGSSIILGWLAWRMHQLRPKSVRVWPLVSGALIIWFVVYCGALTVVSTRTYMSNIAWARAIAEQNGRFFRACSGYYFWTSGMLKEAIPEYEAAIRCEPRLAASYYELSAVWRALRQPEKALHTMLLAKERLGPRGRVEYNLGLAYAELGRMREAADAFQRAVELQPRYWRAWRNLGKARLRLNEFQGAARAYEIAFSINKLDAQAHVDLGRAYKGAGELAKAKREFESAVSADPNGEAGRSARSELSALK